MVKTGFPAHSGVVGEELLWPTWTLAHSKQIGYKPKPGSSFCVHDGRFGSSDLSLAHSLVAYRLGVERRRRGCAPLMCATARKSSRRRRGRAGYAIEEMSRRSRRFPHRYAAKNRFGPDRIPRSSRFLHCLARVDSVPDQSTEDDQANVLTCIAQQPHAFLSGASLQRVGSGRKRIVDPGCALVHKGNGEPFGDGDKVIDVAVAVVRYLARKAHQPEPSFAAAAAAPRARNASVYYGFGSNATKKTRRQHNATLVRKKVPWYKRHGHANATLARRHRGNATGFLRHRRHANATRLHRRPHPRRHTPDGLGAPTPGDAADGVVVAAPAQRAGISSGLEALAALHRKGALTDSEFAAAKAKLLG